MIKFPMTVAGEQKLKDELVRLKTIERPKVIESISEARSHGDLKENAEYHAAKEQQSFLEGRIAEIEGKLANSQVIDISKLPKNGRVVFGTTVVLINVTTNEEVKYKIVGDDEADLKLGMISVNSPIARAIIGKSEDEVVVVRTPGGEIEYEISQVLYIV